MTRHTIPSLQWVLKHICEPKHIQMSLHFQWQPRLGLSSCDNHMAVQWVNDYSTSVWHSHKITGIINGFNVASYVRYKYTHIYIYIKLKMHWCSENNRWRYRSPLRWRHNERDSVSNHQPHDCLLNGLFRRRSKKTSKLRVTGLCVGNSPGPVNSPHKGPVTRKMFPFDDVI